MGHNTHTQQKVEWGGYLAFFITIILFPACLRKVPNGGESLISPFSTVRLGRLMRRGHGGLFSRHGRYGRKRRLLIRA